MNDEYQEALDAINDEQGFNFKDEIKTLQELVDKEKPMKIVKTKNPNWFAVCPSCGKNLGVIESPMNYCPHCGQHLDCKLAERRKGGK